MIPKITLYKKIHCLGFKLVEEVEQTNTNFNREKSIKCIVALGGVIACINVRVTTENKMTDEKL